MVIELINSPNDIKSVPFEELPILAEEIRTFLIRNISRHGGHLSSNLGTVELTMALHLLLDLPKDKIIWDVGHQSYTHKILTGRRERFSTNRKLGGIRPFPSPEESEYDTFACGHASNSISAALGMAVANKNRKVVG